MHVLYQAAEVTWSVPRPGEGRTDKQRIGGTSGREFSQALMFQQASAGGGSRTARKPTRVNGRLPSAPNHCGFSFLNMRRPAGRQRREMKPGFNNLNCFSLRSV
jgi:hypothetical protein